MHGHFYKTHNQYPKEYHDLNKRCCELWREEMSSLNLSNHQSKEWEWKAIVLTFHHRFANVPYHHNNLISRIIPAPDTLMMGVVCLDERMIWHSHTPKVPLILGGCCMKYLVLLVQKIWMFTQQLDTHKTYASLLMPPSAKISSVYHPRDNRQ